MSIVCWTSSPEITIPVDVDPPVIVLPHSGNVSISAMCAADHRRHVTLMVHAFAAETQEEIETVAKPAMAESIRVNIGMQRNNSTSAGYEKGNFGALSAREVEVMTQMQLNQNLQSPLSFIGTLEQCANQAENLRQSGADEIACLIDFGLRKEDVMMSLPRLALAISVYYWFVVRVTFSGFHRTRQC